MRHTALILLLPVVLLCLSCDVGEEDNIPSALVVEGWIDNGDFPVVKLTRTVPISGYVQLDSLASYIEEWAKVTISDGSRTVVMMARRNDDYFPPYTYTTTEMRGETGKTYTLTVDCPDGTHAEAVTTIPPVAVVDSFATERVERADTLRQLYAYVHDDRSEEAYYKVFVADSTVGNVMMSSDMGITETSLLPADGKIAVNRGYTNLMKDYIPFFAEGLSVRVKIVRMDEVAYRFWRGYDDLLSLSRNPLFPVVNNLSSNVDGALGYWFGYGATYHELIIR